MLFCAALAAIGMSWGAMRPTPAYLKRATVYQIVLRNFTRDGNFRAAAEMLDHVRAVGIDAVYLTPFVEMDRDMAQIGINAQHHRILSANQTTFDQYPLDKGDGPRSDGKPPEGYQ